MRLLAGALAAIVVAAAVLAIVELSRPAKKAAVVPPATTATPPPPTTATTPTPPPPPRKRKPNNFTVAYYGNRRTRTRDFKAIPSLHAPFKLAWAFGGNALLEFPATIWGNNLYLIDDGATVKRVNITTGRQIWLRHVGLLSASTPSLDVKHKELFVSILSVTCGTIGCVDGELAAVSMRSGKILWRFPVSSGTESSPMIVGNSVYFGDQAGTFYSLNIKTGHENWSFSTGGSIKGGADYWHGNLYFANYAGSMYAVNARSGREVWSASPGGQYYSTPAVAYGRVYIGNKDGDAQAFNARTGAIAWSAGLSGYVYSGPAVADMSVVSARPCSSARTETTSTRSMPPAAASGGTLTLGVRSQARPPWSTTRCTSLSSTARAATASTHAPGARTSSGRTAPTRPPSRTATRCS